MIRNLLLSIVILINMTRLFGQANCILDTQQVLQSVLDIDQLNDSLKQDSNLFFSPKGQLAILKNLITPDSVVLYSNEVPVLIAYSPVFGLLDINAWIQFTNLDISSTEAHVKFQTQAFDKTIKNSLLFGEVFLRKKKNGWKVRKYELWYEEWSKVIWYKRD